MSTELSLKIVVGAQDAASNVINSVADNIVGKMAGVNPALGMVAGGMMAIVGGSIAVGVESTHMAADFQQAMLSNVAHAGLAKDQFNNVSQAVLGMASAVGRSPVQLAEALYPILSAFSGIQNQSAKSAIALDTLKMSFQTVAGTTVDGTQVANAAVGTFNALGLATNNTATNTQRMTGLFDVMDKTVQLGNMQWDAYKGVVSRLAVAIQGTGISFNESQAALAEMTNEGFTARQAAVYLSNTFGTLAIKTDALAKHAKALKIPFNESAYASMSLADKIAYLNHVTDGNKQKLLALMGSNSTALKTFNALSIGIGGYKSNLDALNHSQGALKSSFDTASQGFNFQMSQIKAAGAALMITIGQQLLPIFSQLAAAALPIIRSFTEWLTKSGALQAAAHGLGGVLAMLGSIVQRVWAYLTGADFAGVIADFQTLGNQIGNIAGPLLSQIGPMLTNAFNTIGPLLTGTVIPAIDTVVFGLDNFLIWMQGADPWIEVIKAALIGVGVAFAAIQIGSFIATIPALVAGFITWGVAAWSAALATIAATWPLLAIGAAIAIVVALIILAVTHWGAITKFLQGVWAAFISWFMGAIHAIGAFFVGVWNSIVTGVKAAWAFIVLAVKIGALLLLAAIFAPIIAIAALFIWLYNHNYYFKALIDHIVAFVKAGLAWVQNAWHVVISWIVEKWVYLSTMATVYWEMLQFIIQMKVGQAKEFLMAVWTSVVSFLTGIWTTISTDVSSMWQKISGFFSGAWSTYIATPLSNLWSSITGFAKGWPAQAVQWGINMIQGFISGITGMIGNVGKAAQQIMGKVAGFLGFHSPSKEGPGQHLLEWPRNMIKSYADEMVGQKAYLENAVKMTIAPIAMMQHAIPVSRPSSTPLVSSSNSTSATSGNGAQTFNVSVTVSGHTEDEAEEIAEAVAKKLGQKLQGSATLAGGLY